LAEEQSLKFSVKVVQKKAARTAQLANCILLHAYSCITATLSCASTNKTSYTVPCLTSWHICIYGYKLRTARLNYEFTGSYKKKSVIANVKLK